MSKVAEDEKERELLRRAKAAGIPVESDTEQPRVSALLISQDTKARDSEVFDVNGGAGLVLALKIVPNIPVFVFSDFHFELDRWKDGWFQPLEEVEDPDWPRYEFHGQSHLKFSREDVLNRFITQEKIFHRGYPARGLLLAFSFAPMPDDIKRGETLEGVIRIYDQFEHRHSASVRVRADRQAVRVPRKMATKRTPLERRTGSHRRV